MKHLQEKGGNISATCRRFGISRATFYKWAKRYNPDKPSKPLLSRSRRPHDTQRPTKWDEKDLSILAELDMKTEARLGAGRLSVRLKESGIELSRATTGRMLAIIRKRCPICRSRGIHHPELHLFRWDIQAWGERVSQQALVRYAMEHAAGDGAAFHQGNHSIRCQATIKSGYRKCKNEASLYQPFCLYHSNKSPAVEGLRLN